MQEHASVASFTNFDYCLILIVLSSAFFAFVKGFIKAALSLCGLVCGILIASWEYLVLAMILHQWINQFEVCEVISFVLILVLVMVLFSVVAQILRKTMKAVGLGLLDRLLGGVFGVLRGGLIGVAIIMAITAFLPTSDWLKNSQLTPYFLAGFHAVSFSVPQHFQDQIAAGAKYLMHEAPELMRPHTLTQHM
jgi:membrane protein required for colicin V production